MTYFGYLNKKAYRDHSYKSKETRVVVATQIPPLANVHANSKNHSNFEKKSDGGTIKTFHSYNLPKETEWQYTLF